MILVALFPLSQNILGRDTTKHQAKKRYSAYMIEFDNYSNIASTKANLYLPWDKDRKQRDTFKFNKANTLNNECIRQECWPGEHHCTMPRV